MLSLILMDLTLREVLADLPHDAGAVVVYLMIALFVGLVWLGGRNRPRA